MGAHTLACEVGCYKFKLNRKKNIKKIRTIAWFFNRDFIFYFNELEMVIFNISKFTRSSCTPSQDHRLFVHLNALFICLLNIISITHIYFCLTQSLICLSIYRKIPWYILHARNLIKYV